MPRTILSTSLSNSRWGSLQAQILTRPHQCTHWKLMTSAPLPISLPPTHVPLADNTWLCRRHAVVGYQHTCRLHRAPINRPTHLIMIDKVSPRQHLQHQSRVSAVSRRHTLHVWGQAAMPIQRLAFLDLVHHLSHVHFDFSSVFGPAVESYWCKGFNPEMLARIEFGQG